MFAEDAIKLIIREYGESRKNFGEFHSAHEGYSILFEEMDELWEEIKAKPRNNERLRREAIQVGAMALCFLVDCT